VFYERDSGKKIAETDLEELYPEDFQVFEYKEKETLAISALKLSSNNSTKLTTSLLVYEGKIVTPSETRIDLNSQIKG
jgi:hypothetical protein